METAIRWSPSSTPSEQRFLLTDVNGHSFTRCKIKRYDGKSLLHEVISTYGKAPAFRAYDWAPNDENLVAVGQGDSGEVAILRIDDTVPTISLPVKRPRGCNAVAFSRTGLLATGLEAIRNDFCLNIWDINQRNPTVTSPGGGTSRLFMEPYRKYASSEAISSIKFFTKQPEVLVAGIKRKGISIYDLRENRGNPSLHFKTERCVHNIALDPLDENYFACAGPPRDPTIQIWDRRVGSPYAGMSIGSGSDINTLSDRPVLEYKEAFVNPRPPAHARKVDRVSTAELSIWSLRYCKSKSGCLGALASNGDFKVFETKHEYSSIQNQYKTQQYPDFDIPNPTEYSMLTKRIIHIEHAFNDEQHGRDKKNRIVAFDFTNLAGSKGTPCAIVLRGNQQVEIVELGGAPPALSVSAQGKIVVGDVHRSILDQQEHPGEDQFLTRNVRRFQPKENAKPSSMLPKPAVTAGMSKSSRQAHEELIESQISNTDQGIEGALNLSVIAQRRCQDGYLFDCKKNIEITSDDPWLQKLWSWIDRAKISAGDDGMVTDTLDLSFFGVASIWNNDLDSQRASNRLSKPTYSREVAAAVETLCIRLELPEFHMTNSNVPNHRRLCLYTCGLGLPYPQLETTVKALVEDGLNTKAAALAIIHDQAKLAFLALRNGKSSETHRELSLALAGFNKGITDSTWDETIQALKQGMDDPYARAILALVSYGNWHDVLAEISLPLRDRLGIALMYLDDEELTQFINETTTECIREGDIEGIVLTGLTEQAVPLFEAYIRKFFDLQTAVLAMSFTCPRYFTDDRVDLWRRNYRIYLNNWSLFIARARFDVQSTKLSTPPDCRPELAPPPRQVSLRCNNCDQALDHNSDNAPRPDPTVGSTTHEGKIFGDAKSGTVCPNCGRHMPRCVICMHWLGVPNPHSRGSISAPISKREAMNKFVSVCRSCWHMSHAGHAEEWFEGHSICPVPDCECRCVEVDVGIP